VLGKCAFDLFSCLKETGEDKYYFEALAGKSVVGSNRPYVIAQSGRNGFFDGYYSPRHDERGEVIGGVAIIRDVTERKLAETEPADEHRRLAFHVENTPLAVIEWDREFRVLRWSPAAQRLFGWKADEVLGKRFSDWEFVVPEDVEAVNQVEQLHEARIDTSLRVVQLRALQRTRQTRVSAFARARRDRRDAYRRSTAKVRSAVSFAL
jgi:PAS domain S-box-containing protein